MVIALKNAFKPSKIHPPNESQLAKHIHQQNTATAIEKPQLYELHNWFLGPEVKRHILGDLGTLANSFSHLLSFLFSRIVFELACKSQFLQSKENQWSKSNIAITVIKLQMSNKKWFKNPHTRNKLNKRFPEICNISHFVKPFMVNSIITGCENK